jgi:hypothetical protein
MGTGSKHKMPSWKSHRWRRAFLQYVKRRLDDWEHGLAVTVKEQGRTVYKAIGIPLQTWIKISADFTQTVQRFEEHYYLFLAGVAVGWVAARKKYEEK